MISFEMFRLSQKGV